MLTVIIYGFVKDFQVLKLALTECRSDDWDLKIALLTDEIRWEKTVPLYFVPAAWLLS